MDKKKKFRAEFRKNRTPRTRPADWTKQFSEHGFEEETPPQEERISGKGDLTRHRTVRGTEASAETDDGRGVQLEVDESACRPGRVLSVHGLTSNVQDEDGQVWQCVTRRLLKTLSSDQRHVVTAGDRVLFRPVENSQLKEGIIQRIEPRHDSLSRTVRGRQQIIVTNIDQLLIVASAGEPHLKPNLIDRMLVAAEQGRILPIICINKIDLVEPASLQPLVGVYGQMGYTVLLLSAKSGFGIDRLGRMLAGRASVVAGQSGVGKSSMLNAVDANLHLRVQPVSSDTEKGCHTTTTAQLIPLACSGWVVDTPGIRQFQLWDVIPEEVAGVYRDLRPYVSLCRFPNCTHTHEADCAIKNAVADGRLDERRYESYCRLFAGDLE